MARRSRRPATEPTPPLLAYIDSNRDEERHAARRQDAEAAIGRLYAEQANLIAADQAAPAEIAAANVAVLEIAEQAATIGDELRQVMEGGGDSTELRHAYADLRGRLVDARSHLDHLTRAAAERARRLSQITPDIESWDDRRHEAGKALRACRVRRGAE